MSHPHEPSPLDTANKVGSFLNNWGKIIGVLGIAIISCAFAYVKIYDNERNIELYKKDAAKELVELKKDMDAQLKNMQDASDKKFNQGMDVGNKLEEFGMYHEKRIVQLEKDNAYIKGTLKLDK